MDISIKKIGVENITDMPDFRRIEYAGRVCYQSTDRMTKDSAIKFLPMLRDKKHYSVFGHAQLLIITTDDIAVDIDLRCPLHLKNQFVFATLEKNKVLVGAGYDAWLQFFEVTKVFYGQVFKENLPIIFGNLPDNKYTNTGNFKIEFTSDEQLPLGVQTAAYMFKETFSIKADRATAMQLRTYRYATHSIESQRYVNYEKHGFNYVMPPEINDLFVWENKKKQEAENYLEWLQRGYKPEVARNALGQDILTEHVMTACLWEWRHIFKMRLNNATQSNTRTVVQLIYDNLMEKYTDSLLGPYLEGYKEDK